MSERSRQAANIAAAVSTMAAVAVISAIPFGPERWNGKVQVYGPAILLALLILAATLWSAGHSRRGRPSPIRRALPPDRRQEISAPAWADQ